MVLLGSGRQAVQPLIRRDFALREKGRKDPYCLVSFAYFLSFVVAYSPRVPAYDTVGDASSRHWALCALDRRSTRLMRKTVTMARVSWRMDMAQE